MFTCVCTCIHSLEKMLALELMAEKEKRMRKGRVAASRQ